MKTSAQPKNSEPTSLPTCSAESPSSLTNAETTAKYVTYISPMMKPAMAARMR